VSYGPRCFGCWLTKTAREKIATGVFLLNSVKASAVSKCVAVAARFAIWQLHAGLVGAGFVGTAAMCVLCAHAVTFSAFLVNIFLT